MSQSIASFLSTEECVDLIAKIGDGFFVCDTQGYLIDANPAACHLLGYGRSEIASINVVDTLGARDETSSPANIGDSPRRE